VTGSAATGGDAAETLSVHRDGPLATLTIRRESALNALNEQVLRESLAAIASLETDPSVRAVIVTGAGKAFVAGGDIAHMQNLDEAGALAFAASGNAVGFAIERSTRVYIAAVNGFALGGGCELALACDFIYASSRAKLGQPEVKLGVIPGFGGTQRLARRVGVAKAKELILTGAMVTADEALRIGLVDAVCEPDQLLERVTEAGRLVAANGPCAVAAAKRAIHVGQSMPLADAIDLEQSAFAALFGTPEQVEGMTAFLQKRPAAFDRT
jgi:enoyl-CoA hydratase